MKREGNLIAKIATRDNLLLAFWKASRGRRAAHDVVAFGANLEAEIVRLAAAIESGHVAVGDYHRFEIRDPKPRTIFAPRFAERVLHHAIMNVCEPRLDRFLIDATYACRRDKGTTAALPHAQRLARRCRFVLKLDIARYFDNVDHAILRQKLARLFKDQALLGLVSRILDSYATAPGKGLPIGTLTSQHFANLYLGYLDHHVQDVLRCRGYVRYMDDFLLFANERAQLRTWLLAVQEWLARELALRVKPPIIASTTGGFGFLGFRVRPTHLALSGARKRRFAAAMRNCACEFARGEFSEQHYANRLTAMVSHANRARTRGLRARLLAQMEADGLPVSQ